MPIAINGSGTVTGISTGGISDTKAVADAAMPAGSILQVVHVTKTDHFTTTSTTYTDVTGMAASITPTSANSEIIVRFDLQLGGSSNLYAHAKCQRLIAGGSYADLQKGDTVGQHERANMNMDSDVSYGYVKGYNNSFSLKDSTHNTTSQITYKLVCHCSAGTIYVNRYHNDSTNSTAGTSSVMLMEVAA
tara:strand:- start:285 stop:854 length:570 start_codon:yes stop_codon:yes gene_type:complete